MPYARGSRRGRKVTFIFYSIIFSSVQINKTYLKAVFPFITVVTENCQIHAVQHAVTSYIGKGHELCLGYPFEGPSN